MQHTYTKKEWVISLAVILIRLVIVYVLLTLTVRFMGKRQIGEMQMSELVVAFMLSELAAMPITDTGIPLLYSILPIVLLAVLEILTSFAFLHMPRLSRLVAGVPQVIIRGGEIDRRMLTVCRMTLSELMGELRLAGYGDPRDIAYAILEENGRLSVIPRAVKAPPSAKDLAVHVTEGGICHIIIADGMMNPVGIKNAFLTAEEVTKYLKHQGNTSVDDVFLLTRNDAGIWHLIKKNRGGRR